MGQNQKKKKIEQGLKQQRQPQATILAAKQLNNSSNSNNRFGCTLHGRLISDALNSMDRGVVILTNMTCLANNVKLLLVVISLSFLCLVERFYQNHQRS